MKHLRVRAGKDRQVSQDYLGKVSLLDRQDASQESLLNENP
jgi:hypothetical protein